MHQAQKYIDTNLKPISPNGKLSAIALTAAQATALNLALSRDASDYIYSGIVSIGDAVQAIEKSLFTWATVKLYYAVFYITRALLAAHGTAIIYDGTKPYSWSAIAGAMATKSDGPTHKAVLISFSTTFPTSFLLSQPVGLDKNAIIWLMKRREEVNYTNPRFAEPTSPTHFNLIAQTGLRKCLSAYFQDNTFLYAFDPQHAILSFPIEVFKLALKPISNSGAGIFLKDDDRKYLSNLYADKNGPIAEAVKLLRP